MESQERSDRYLEYLIPLFDPRADVTIPFLSFFFLFFFPFFLFFISFFGSVFCFSDFSWVTATTGPSRKGRERDHS